MDLQLRPQRSVDAARRWWTAPTVWSKENPLQSRPWSSPPRPPSVVLLPDDSYLENEHLRPDTPSDIESEAEDSST